MELRKAFYTKIRFRNNFLKNPDLIKQKVYKQQEANVCLFEENQSNTISVTLQVQEEQPTKCFGNLLNFFLQTKVPLKNVTSC